jgi:hypothetical protein
VTFNVKFNKSNQVIKTNFGKTYKVEQGDYEEVYNKGYESGYSTGYTDGANSVPIKEEQEKVVDITENGTTEVTPDEGKTLSKVTVNVAIESGGGDIDENLWQEDTSEVVIEKSCYQNSQVSVYITKNGTMTYKRNKLEYTNHCPKWNHSSLSNFIDNQGTKIGYWRNIRQMEVINIPEATEGYLITELGNSTCFGLINLKVVRLPDTITAIGSNTFYHCNSLEKLILPDSIVNIGVSAFRDCYNLKHFKVPMSTTSLGSYCFASCYLLKSIDGIERIESIGSNCFDGCMSLEGVITINEKVPAISNNTFRDCCNITGFIFRGIPTIEVNAFSNCVNMYDITIPKGWNKNLYIYQSSLYSQDVLHALVENLADMSTAETQPTFQVGTTNIAKIDEVHIEMLESKGWLYK